MWWRSSIIIGSRFLVVFSVLAITFCLVSAGIFKANTSIGIAAYATKSEGSSGGDKSDGEGNGGSDNSGGDGSSGTGGENNPTIEESICLIL